MTAKDRGGLRRKLEEAGLTLRKNLVFTDTWPMQYAGRIVTRDGLVEYMEATDGHA